MKIILAHSTYDNCYLVFGQYDNDRPALTVHNDSGVILKASVNLPDIPLPEGYIFIKDWSENQGILQSLISNNVIDFPESSIPCGYVQAHMCKLLTKHSFGTSIKGED